MTESRGRPMDVLVEWFYDDYGVEKVLAGVLVGIIVATLVWAFA